MRARTLPVYLVGLVGLSFLGCVPGPADGDGLPGGESTSFSADLTGGQETPSVTTTAGGTGTFELAEDGHTLTFEITAMDFPGTVTTAHFHVGATGVAGPIVFDLTGFIQGDADALTIDGTTDLADWGVDDPVAELLDGNIYVNIHSEEHPAGEIRGQLSLP